MKNVFMQKAGIVAQQLSQDFIGMDIGDRIPTIEDFVLKYQSARGTVQQALTHLKDYNAIGLESRGHMGTFIATIDYALLMKICSVSNLIGAMPLPYSKRYEGLATAIYSVLNDNTGISVNLAFMGGSNRRVEALLEGRYNFAVMSLVAAQHYIDEGFEIEISHCLGVHSYVHSHSLIMASDFYSEPKCIGVDKTSYDQLSLTMKFFENKDIEIVPLQYSHVLENIKNKTIDAAIWSLEERILNDRGLRYVELSGIDMHEANTQAVIVIKKNDIPVSNFLKRFFFATKVEEIQQLVQKNQMLPNY